MLPETLPVGTLAPALTLGRKALPVLAGTRGTFICRMLLPTPGTPSQLRLETGLPVPCGSPHVPSWLKPLAVAATGSITRPADASAEVRNIRDLTDILRFLRHLGHEWSCATLHDPCQRRSPHVLTLSRNGTAVLWRSVWGTTDKNPVIAETQIWRLLRHFGIAGERMRASARTFVCTYIGLRPPAPFMRVAWLSL